ncbi:neuropeptide CCHamide-2 receptor-like [Neodiprion fabricii]|uniref:neuropeptide CCHamide-2 receptor-like n=1 Tax=Neodiprion fabricii TaxID=2872261 RepID=UPI001ED8D7C5|nr:neuropeptide CCHamide-2 receptor-like [Neodiprion fabricii]
MTINFLHTCVITSRISGFSLCVPLLRVDNSGMSSQMSELGSNAESDVGIEAQYFGSVGSSDRVAMNISENLYLAITRGQQYCDLDFAIPMTLTYVTIFITGVFGNVMTCLVVIRNPTMQTATNYYLFSLAISDLTLLLLGMPFLRFVVNRLTLRGFTFHGTRYFCPWILGEMQSFQEEFQMSPFRSESLKKQWQSELAQLRLRVTAYYKRFWVCTSAIYK